MKTLQAVNPKGRRKPKKQVNQKLIIPKNQEALRKQFRELREGIGQYQAEQGNPEPLSMEEVVAIVKETRAEIYAEQHND